MVRRKNLSGAGLGLTAAVALVGATYAPSVHALCYKPDPNAPPITVDISSGPIYVRPGADGVLDVRRFPAAIPGRCDNSFTRFRMPLVLADEAGTAFYTNVPGVAIRIMEVRGSDWLRIYSDRQIYESARFGDAEQVEVILFRMSKEVAPGKILPPGLVASHWKDGDGMNNPVANIIMGGLGTTIMPTTCNVAASSKNIVVDFGTVSRSEFSGVGSRAKSRDFSVDIECSSISSVYNTVGLRVDGVADPSNLPGVLAINSGSDAAQGVAIELVRTKSGIEQPMPLAEFVEMGKVGGDSTFLSIPLRARYIQTAAAGVTPGKANGIATFTIEYK